MNRLLKSITTIKEFHNMKPFTIEFHAGINVIVGENGSGKSSLFYLLTQSDDSYRTIEAEPNTDVKSLDTEKDNPRMKGDLRYTKNLTYVLGSHFLSHGETMIPLFEALKEVENTVIIIDEPEVGLSIRNQSRIYNILKQTTKRGCQVVITTHSYAMIKRSREVFCMDTMTWMPSKNYLKKVGL